ncbi:MAG: response regulator [Ignavibacteriales bacterium]|nr:response regulator [Ignavibacteriales bacterium]MCB9258500.1 response regulator [Ignavibacteriales bacterium]
MKKVLVIDDQPGNVFLLQDRLNKEGYKVITAYDGTSGIKKAKDDSPDLILLDVMMPGIDGFETCKEISSKKETSHIPVIMVTALNSTEDIQKGFDSGAFDYIKKPFNKVELLARVRSAVRFSETNKLLIELEKINTFSATVKKTNHEIKQPLTLINLSVTALKRELEQLEINKDSAVKRVEFIETAAADIVKIMQSMLNIDKIELNNFIENIKKNEFKINSEVDVLE